MSTHDSRTELARVSGNIDDYVLRTELARVTHRYRVIYRAYGMLLAWVASAFAAMAALTYLRGGIIARH